MSDELELDNPMLVRWEFASEERLATRNALYRELEEGTHAEDVVVDAVRAAGAKHVLEVGCGAGEMARRIAHELGAKVLAADTSQRMIDLARQRGVDASIADVQALPFEDASFDCVVAGWVLYHVRDRDRAIGECARVLRSGGWFVVGTLADDNLVDLWRFLGYEETRRLTFSSANGAEQLARHFPRVETREAQGVVVFRTSEAMRKLVAADITRAHLSANVPVQLAEPFRAHTHHTVFVAEKA